MKQTPKMAVYDFHESQASVYRTCDLLFDRIIDVQKKSFDSDEQTTGSESSNQDATDIQQSKD